MSLAELRSEFLAVRVARGLARRGLFREKNPGALRDAVAGLFSDEMRKEHALDDEARRLLDSLRGQIASEGADSNELYRKIRRKLAEQKGIVL
jgi:hypothetical protein